MEKVTEDSSISLHQKNVSVLMKMLKEFQASVNGEEANIYHHAEGKNFVVVVIFSA